MRISLRVAFFLVVVLAVSRLAYAGDPQVLVSEDNRHIDVRLLQAVDKTEALCDQDASTPQRDCREIFNVEYFGSAVYPPESIPTISEASVDIGDDHTLHLTLSEPISMKRKCSSEEISLLKGDPCLYDLSDFTVVLRRILLGKDKDPQPLLIAIAPTVVEDYGTRDSVMYHGIRESQDAPKASAVTVAVTEKSKKTKIPTRVVSVEKEARKSTFPSSNWRVYIDPPLERGSNLGVAISGIDSYADQSVGASGSIQVEDYPKGRDDATFYLRGEKVVSRVGEDTGSVDFKLEQSFRRAIAGTEWWYLIDATVGSRSLDLSQTGTVSVGYRRWLGVDADLRTRPAWNVSAAPTFRTDRDFKNRDLGLDLISELQPGFWYKTIEQRQKDEDNPDIHTGFSAKAKFALEGGRHLASSSAEVDGGTFARALVGLNLLLEKEKIFRLFDKVSLTVDLAGRYLARDEVTMDEDEVLKISDGFKPYLRAELAYGLGPVALSVVHENGKLPPNFKRAHATTLGLTVKF